MSDAANIFNLHLESKEPPQMTVGEYGNKRWRLHGELHREDGPAYEHADGSKRWHLHGKRHREDGAAIECIDGSKEWYLHGELHREDGAAIEYIDGTKYWYLHGKLHREDGAAFEYSNGYKEWWLHGKHYETPEAWAQALLKQRHQPHDANAANEFLMPILDKYIE